MFGGLFNMDKPFWRWMSRVPEILILSLCFYLCCIPVVTIIPASCALFDAISRCVVPDEKGCYTRFFRTFCRELKQGIPLTILWLVIGFIGLYGDRVLAYNAENNSTIALLSLLYRLLLISTVGYLGWLIPLESRYYHGFVRLHINALSFYFGRLPGTFYMLFMTALVLIVSLAHPYAFFLLAFAPGLIAVMHTPSVEKGFRKAFPEDYDEAGQLRSPEE